VLLRTRAHGRRWRAVYWPQIFTWEHRSVNVAQIPQQLLTLLEEGKTTIEQVVLSLATRFMPPTLPELQPYCELWEEAVHYALGVREDILRANAAADTAFSLWEQGKAVDAVYAANVARELENELAGFPRYWQPFFTAIVQAAASKAGTKDPLIQRHKRLLTLRQKAT